MDDFDTQWQLWRWRKAVSTTASSTSGGIGPDVKTNDEYHKWVEWNERIKSTSENAQTILGELVTIPSRSTAICAKWWRML